MTTEPTQEQEQQQTTDAADQPEGFQLRQTGRIAIWWPGFQTLIARPKIGQFKQLREKFSEISVDNQHARRRLEALTEASKELEDDDVDGFAKIQAEVDDIDEFRFRNVVEWIADVNRVLGSTPFPITEDGTIDVDAVPLWVGNATLPTSILAHWRSVPLAPGGKAK